MTWSPSMHKTLNRCTRQWYFKHKAAHSLAKNDPERIEITRLSKLKTIQAWRGGIVDQIISELIIQRIRRKEDLSATKILLTARKVFDKQFLLATGHSMGNGFKPEFSFVDFEYGRVITEDIKGESWREIELAINNFLNDEALIQELRGAEMLLPQWVLQFQHDGVNVKAIPDLIAFSSVSAPKIYDWKVHTEGIHANEMQLLSYAVALTRARPQDRYAEYLLGINPSEIALTEVQLIADGVGHKRSYQANEENVKRVEDLISSNMLKIHGMGGDLKYAKIQASDFETTDFPGTCKNCPFQKPCKSV